MKLLIAGDYSPLERIQNKMSQGDYSYFDDVKDIIKAHDFSIVNLECPICDKYDRPIDKNGPNLSTSANVIPSLQYAGFNIVTTANNHILDYGETALKQTLNSLDSAKISHVGSGYNLAEASKPLILNCNQARTAIINCCENEFSIATNTKGGANPIDIIDIARQIKTLKETVNYIIIITHGGHEICQLPPISMKKRNRFFIEMGADAVINHHQHVFSGYEIYDGKPIFYGIGNFCFDREGIHNQLWNIGFMISLDLSTDVKVEIIPYDQCSDEPKIKKLSSESMNIELQKINEIIKDDEILTQELNKYYERQYNQIKTAIQPFSNRLISGLIYKGFLPSLISKKTLLRLQNWVLCESHRAKLEYYFYKKQK